MEVLTTLASDPPFPYSALARTLETATEEVAGKGACCILYSGGVDSSLVAHLLRARRPLLVAVGTPGAPDLGAAAAGAETLGLELRARNVTLDDLRSVQRRWHDELGALREPSRSVAIGLAAALEAVPEGRVFCGQGADELFYGYAHFNGLTPDQARVQSERDWSRLIGEDWPRAARIARSNQQELASPFLDPGVVRLAQSIPSVELLGGREVRKPVLRALALALGVPPSLANRPKKALQYGSGVAHLLRTADRTGPG